LTYVIATHNYRFNALDTLQTFNSGLSYPKDYILNEKRINEYIMDLYIRDSLYLTSPEMDDVRDIADQCPDEGGSSVYRARAIRSLFEEANYLFNCSTVSLPILHTYNQKLTDLLMFPNPASDELTFLRKGNDEDLEINLLNINGSIISKWKLLKENTQMTVSLANIPAGVYIAKGISVDGRFISGMKLIVIKN
ncbi:MAG TPA: T9SS type A sorting domain-containing protein, partial [Saprospiraceae bacterium]|nr:T9SS type A sorting domain-containing protein [Saprospiraceae bacterium]